MGLRELAFLFLVIVVAVAFSYHFGVKEGRKRSMKDFKNQLSSNAAFYNHNLKSCGKRIIASHTID